MPTIETIEKAKCTAKYSGIIGGEETALDTCTYPQGKCLRQLLDEKGIDLDRVGFNLTGHCLKEEEKEAKTIKPLSGNNPNNLNPNNPATSFFEKDA